MSKRWKLLIMAFFFSCLPVLISVPRPGLAQENELKVKSIFITVSDGNFAYAPVLPGETISTRPGGSLLISLRAIYSNGEDKAIPDVIWQISDPQVVRIHDNVLSGIKEGAATVTANYEGLTASVKVLVSPVVSLVASPASLNAKMKNGKIILKDGGCKIRLTAVLASGVRVNVSRGAEWESSNPEIVTIAGGGLIPKIDMNLVSHKEGIAEVTAGLNGMTTNFTVEVMPYKQSTENSPPEPAISVKINGVTQTYDQPPVKFIDGIFVPMRDIFEALGASVSWDGQFETVTVTHEGTTIRLKVHSVIAFKDGMHISLEQPLHLINGRTMAPVSFMAEALGVNVDWDETAQAVLITYTPQPSVQLSSLRMFSETTGWAMGSKTVLRTSDGGSQWPDVTPPGIPAGSSEEAVRLSAEFFDADTAWVAAAMDTNPALTVFHTTDGGQTWHGVEVATKNSGRIYGASIDFIDPVQGWLLIDPEHGMNSSPGELFATADGGEHWFAVASTDGIKGSLPFAGAISFRNASNGWVAGSSISTANRLLYVTQDGGRTWQPQSLTLPPGYPAGKLDVNVPPAFFPPSYRDGVLPATFVPDSYKAVEYGTIIYVTHNQGKTWQSRKLVEQGYTPEFINSNDGWMWVSEPRDTGSSAPVNGKLYRTTNGGQNWNAVSPDETLEKALQNGENIVELDFITEKSGWALLMGRKTTLLKTSDGGYTWAVQGRSPGTMPSALNPKPSSPEVNPAAFKDQGDLAFVWQDLLCTLDGKTGEVRQLTESGRALNPAWSHDGEWLAFIRVTDPQAMTGPLWLVRRDGTQAHQAQGLPGPVCLEYFLWSPTANVLAVGGRNGLWLVPADGIPRQLAPEDEAQGRPGPLAGIYSFAWSPDGKSLAYNVTLPYDDPQSRSDALYTVAVEGAQPVKHIITPQSGIQIAAWWPDGKGILYWLDPMHSASLAADGMGLFSLRLGDKEPKLLAGGLAHREWLSLSPQGRLLMVTGGMRIVWERKSLAVINVESGSVRELQNPAGCVALDPSFSPDGSRIAFVAAKNLGDGVWGFNEPDELAAWVATHTLWIENADGSGAHPLTSAGAGVYQPAWSKDGTHILYVRDNALWITGADGGKPEKVLGPFPENNELFGFYGFVAYDNFAWFQP